MHRTDAPGNASGLFSPGNPLSGQEATMVDHDIMNAFQENICLLIETAGLSLEKGNHAQLRLAVAAMIAGSTISAATILSRLITVDGSGSLVDADLLDGQHGAYYLPASGYSAADVLAKLLTLDGSGSGIDGDLWRGMTPAQFFTTYFPAGSNGNGYWRKRPIGAGTLLEQNGVVVGPFSGEISVPITFPVAYSVAPPLGAIIVSGGIVSATVLADLEPQIIESSISTTGFSAMLQCHGNSDKNLNSVTWACAAAA